MVGDIRVTVFDTPEGKPTGKRKYRHGVSKRNLLSTLREACGVGDLRDSEDYDIESSDDVLVAGQYRYVRTVSPSAGNP